MNSDKKIALAQINPELGNIEKNALKIIDYIKKAEDKNVDIIVFPELSLTGCPLSDVAKRHPVLVENNKLWLEEIAAFVQKTSAIIGFINNDEKGNLYNSAAVIENGSIKKIINKQNLSHNDKSFSIKNERIITEISDLKCAVIIGEQRENFDENVDLIINISACESRNGLEYKKAKSLKNLAQKLSAPIVYVNLTGAVDNFSFDGASRILNNNGDLITDAKSFEEDFVIAALSDEAQKYILKEPVNEPLNYEEDLERTYKTVIQGIKDYFEKNGLKRAVLGLSGGLDSSVTATLLADALGAENVFGVSMPSKITSQESKDDAQALAENLGIGFCTIPIKDIVNSLNDTINPLFEKVSNSGSWQGNRYEKSYTQDNYQARTRATILFAVSNEFANAIPIVTCDKSESYVGYATINGDMSGGFAPIDDITKTKLFALARWLNKNRSKKNAIPENVLLKAPGAELAINPETGKTLKAEEALMPYEFMDEIIWRIENKKECYDDMLNSEFIYEKKNNISQEQKKQWLDKFFRRISTSLYKWSIAAPSVIVENETINASDYSRPVCSGKINYKRITPEEIKNIISLST